MYALYVAYLLVVNCFISASCVSLANGKSSGFNAPSIGVYQKNFAGKIVKVISESGDSDATLPSLDVTDHIWEGKSIELDCNASYPVEWTYSGPGSPAVHVQTYRQSPDFANPETYRFSSTVTFTHTDRKQTGSYSCKSIKDPSLQNSIYLFVPGKTRLFLDGPARDANNITTLFWSSETNGTNSPWILFPCAVAVKDTIITLYKNESSVPFKLGTSNGKSDATKYDPKLGFSYKWESKNGEEGPWGMYFCQGLFKGVPKNMAFNLSKPDSSANQSLPGELSIIYNEKERRIECCTSGTDEPVRPKMIQSRCESVSDCELRHKFVQDKPCSQKCLEHLHDSSSERCSVYQLGNYTDSGLIQCSWPRNDSSPNGVSHATIVDSTNYLQFSYANNGVFISEFETMPALENILQLFKEDVPENSTASYACHANHFFFSHGLKWGLRAKSGSLTFIPEEQFPAKHQIQVDGDENEYLLCFAPVWNSATEWRNVSIKLN